jgi:hypothetical protein
MYNIDYTKLIRRMLPKVTRLPKWMAWIYALTKPLRSIDEDFEELRDEITAQYGYNGLKHSLEKLLNDRWDPVERDIYIEVVQKLPVLFIKDDGEQPDAYLKDDVQIADYFTWDADDVNNTLQVDYEFKIVIPVSVSFIPEEVIDAVNLYRFAGLRPRIFTLGIGGQVEVAEDFNQAILGNG